MKVFIDTNILIDFLAARQPFAEDAIALFQLTTSSLATRKTLTSATTQL